MSGILPSRKGTSNENPESPWQTYEGTTRPRPGQQRPCPDNQQDYDFSFGVSVDKTSFNKLET